MGVSSPFVFRDQNDIQKRKAFLREIVSSQFERAQTHITLITGAGYVGFFTTWNTVSDSFPAFEKYFSLMFMIFSLIVFISWEVFKMVKRSFLNKHYIQALQAPIEMFDNELSKVNFHEENFNLINEKIWPAILFLTYVPGVISAFILIYGCIKSFLLTI